MASDIKNRREFHPAVSIFSWLLVAIAVESAAPRQLPWLAAVLALLLAHAEAGRRFLRLAWKARWLWLALACLHAWTIPGTLVWPSDFSPTLEGLEAGLIRIARLVLLLAALARLMAEFSPRQLAAGIYLLVRPLAWLGLDRRALAVRLALTLERLEQPRKSRDWLAELRSPFDAQTGPEEIRLPLAAASLRDALVLAGAAALLGAVLGRLTA